ncbi:survival motor neuron interacting protein 1-domain-containing protein [Suillus ampliporus]|nr:survival motor neuron interacting protein 1-domain-containing protein [Suillus ampliporus]
MISIGIKRKREDVAYDSDDDEPTFGKQTLPVANLPMDFDREPEDGMEYLFTVRRDARQLPHVTRVANPYELPEPVQPLDLAQPAVCTRTNLPSELWRSTFLTHFRNLRKNIAQPTIHVHIDPHGSHKAMPDKKERDLWWTFLAGSPESDWNPPKKPKKFPSKKSRFSSHMRAFCDESEVGHDTNDEQNHHDTQETWRINSEGDIELAEDDLADTPPSAVQPLSVGSALSMSPAETEPRSTGPLSTRPGAEQLWNPREITPSLLRKIDHNMSLHLLMYFAHWMNIHLQHPADPTFAILESHAHWMFALLAKVEDFISADDMSQLRNLARACLELLVRRQKAGGPGVPDNLSSKSGMTETSCWIIFTAVSGIWGQSDLWRDAETLLASA